VNGPQCTNARIHQSRRKGIIERILAVMFVRPFRCDGIRCLHISHRNPNKIAKNLSN